MKVLSPGFRDWFIALLLAEKLLDTWKTTHTLPQSHFLYKTGFFGISLEMLVFNIWLLWTLTWESPMAHIFLKMSCQAQC